ncbi:MAG: LptA/OstA family protein [Cyanobacteria bacterium P01_C01_bin.89]
MGKLMGAVANQISVDQISARQLGFSGDRPQNPLAKLIAAATAAATVFAPAAQGQTPPPPTVVRNPITVLSDIQESNSEAGTVTARGNVFVDYPSRNLEATSAQAQYFSNERRLVLAGDVLVLQEGNSLRAEVVTYYVDEGRMVALPQPNRQVESIYLIPEGPAPGAAPAPIDESLLNGAPDGAVSVPVEAVPPANGSESFDQNQGPFDFEQ